MRFTARSKKQKAQISQTKSYAF